MPSNKNLMWHKRLEMEKNALKYKVIGFSRARSMQTFYYLIYAVRPERVNPIKDLGVTMDCKMNFIEYISIITAKCFAVLGFIRRKCAEFRNIHALFSTTPWCAVFWNTGFK